MRAGEELPDPKGLTFRGADFAPDAGGQIRQCQAGDPDADQAKGRVADGSGHAANLAVFAFRKFQADPTVRHIFPIANGRIPGRQGGLGVQAPSPTGKGGATGNRYAPRQFL